MPRNSNGTEKNGKPMEQNCVVKEQKGYASRRIGAEEDCVVMELNCIVKDSHR